MFPLARLKLCLMTWHFLMRFQKENRYLNNILRFVKVYRLKSEISLNDYIFLSIEYL